MSMQVSDALGDTNLTSWVKKLADMVKGTDWDQQQQAGTMLCSVFSLPPHLLNLLITSCLTQPSHRYLSHLSKAICQLPPPLHPALLRTYAEASGGLRFSADVADKVLLTLPLITIPSPGLQHIEFSHSSLSQPCISQSTLAQSALLARAASAHPSLTRLSLTSAPLPPGWLRAFAACLAPGALPALADLTLCTDAHPSDCADTITCLRVLPALTSLDISFSVPSQSAAAPASISAYTRLSATPAALPHLQRLSYRDGTPRKSGRSHPHCPLKRSRQNSRVHSFLSLIGAPALTRLELTVFTLLPARMQALQTQLARFTSLEKITVTATIQPPSNAYGLPGRTIQPASLPRLVELDINGLSTVAPFCIGSAIAELGRASLTSITLVHDDSPLFSGAQVDNADDDISTHAANTAAESEVFHFFHVLGGCAPLQKVNLISMPGAPHFDGLICSHGLLPALGRLQQLTLLWLRPAEFDRHLSLDGHQVGGLISRLARLRHLSFDGPRGMSITPVQPVIDACVRLKHVTHLDVSFQDVTRVHINALLTQLSSLKRLGMMRSGLRDPEQAAQEVAELVARFPAVEIDVAGLDLD